MLRLTTAVLMLTGMVCLTVRQAFADDRPAKAAVAELLEDNGEFLLSQFNSLPHEGQGAVERKIVFSGRSCVKIIPLQRYNPKLPGWKYRIAEMPKPGEYRYLRLAWKGPGCLGIMIQLHEEKKTWFARYMAGFNTHGGWHPTKVVAAKPPTDWEMMTYDMFKDFGEGTYTGMALTVFGGMPGYFDHIYFGRTIDDLDRIDVTGLRNGKPIVVTPDDLQRFWKELAGTAADKTYLAFWTLVAAPKDSVPFLEKKLADDKTKSHLKEIKQWIAELNDNKFIVREKASKSLEQHLEEAADLLLAELEKDRPPEVFLRVEKLIALRKGPEIETLRIEKAVRVLEFAATAAAKESLTRLAKEGNAPAVQKAALAALKRLGS
jgi:hypothetical protein